jgi:hypothetical protein
MSYMEPYSATTTTVAAYYPLIVSPSQLRLPVNTHPSHCIGPNSSPTISDLSKQPTPHIALDQIARPLSVTFKQTARPLHCIVLTPRSPTTLQESKPLKFPQNTLRVPPPQCPPVDLRAKLQKSPNPDSSK